MTSAGSILEGAFGLVRDHPAAVAIWGLIYLVAVAGTALLVQPLMLGAASDPEAIAANMQSMFGQLMLFQFLFFLLFVAMWTAALRAILRPTEGGVAFLRFGMDEIRMIILTVVIAILIYAGLVVAIIAAIMIGAAAYAAAGAAAAIAVGVIAAIAALSVIIWLEVRLSLAFPLTLLRGDIIIAESWRLTRGRFWPLFGAYLVIFVVVTALSIAASFASTGSYLVDLIQNMGDPEGLQRVIQAQMASQLGEIDAMTILGWVLSAAAGALTIALGGGAVATAVRDLTANRESVGDTFA
jgi:hypothetical protein